MALAPATAAALDKNKQQRPENKTEAFSDFVLRLLVLCSYNLISISTPAGKLSFIKALIVCWLGSNTSIKRLCVRISNCSCESLSINGERITLYFSTLVGNGTGPATSAPVRSAASTICLAD